MKPKTRTTKKLEKISGPADGAPKSSKSAAKPASRAMSKAKRPRQSVKPALSGDAVSKRGRPSRQVPNSARWKSLFSLLLRCADNPPTSHHVSRTVAKYAQARGYQRTISVSLIEKWRSSSASQLPPDPIMANSVVDALEELQVIRQRRNEGTDELYSALAKQFKDDPEFMRAIDDPVGSAVPDLIRDKLIQWLFDHEKRKPHLEAALHQLAHGAVHELFHELKRRAAQSDSWSQVDTALAAACLLSGQDVIKAAIELQKLAAGSCPPTTDEKSVVHDRQIILFLHWDARDASSSRDARKQLLEDIEEKTSTEFITRDCAGNGVVTHVVFGVQQNDPDDNANCITELTSIADGLLGLCDDDSKEHLFVWRRKLHDDRRAPFPIHDYWVLLLPDGQRKAWRSVRHGDLFKRIRYSAATRFVSPLSHDELNDLLVWLGAAPELEFNRDTQRWRVAPGQRLGSQTSSKTSSSRHDDE